MERPRRRSDTWRTVRLLGLTAAGLVAAVILALAAYGGEEKIGAACSATDRKFIRDATLNLNIVSTSGQDFLTGSVRAKDLIQETKRAAAVVERTEPTDASLKRTQQLLAAMFTEYGRAIEARSRKRVAGWHMYRAYGLANFAHDVLETAKPALAERGCDVSPLL